MACTHTYAHLSSSSISFVCAHTIHIESAFMLCRRCGDMHLGVTACDENKIINYNYTLCALAPSVTHLSRPSETNNERALRESTHQLSLARRFSRALNSLSETTTTTTRLCFRGANNAEHNIRAKLLSCAPLLKLPKQT